MKKLFAIITLFCLLSLPGFAGKKDRGVAKIGKDAPVYLEKGQWIMGGNFAWSQHANNNYSFLLVEGINSRGHQFSINPTVLCGVSKNLAVGVTGIYRRGFMDLESAGLTVKDISIKVTDYYTLSHKYGARAFVRPYLPIGNSGRVAFYVDCGVTALGGQGKVTDRQGQQVIGTYQTSWEVDLTANPGISAFITRHFAIEAGLGYFGLGYTSVKQIHNQVAEGSRTAPNAYLSINPLSISIGFYFSF